MESHNGFFQEMSEWNGAHRHSLLTRKAKDCLDALFETTDTRTARPKRQHGLLLTQRLAYNGPKKEHFIPLLIASGDLLRLELANRQAEYSHSAADEDSYDRKCCTLERNKAQRFSRN